MNNMKQITEVEKNVSSTPKVKIRGKLLDAAVFYNDYKIHKNY